ncbi:MAG: hypothetical protein II662_00855 [Bacteroidales bacterium]|nr:hypothetical protein [Bacteroidales bacterium]
MEQANKKKRASTATIRKAFEKGVRTQKPMTFRLDSDLDEKLGQEANKGRLINDLLREHFKKLGN